jgi:hypothetical protein
MTASLENRQDLSGDDEQEKIQREADTRQLVNDIVGRSGEFFALPENRLEFMQSQDADGFYRMAQHVNARLRGERPSMLRRDANEKGAFLMALHTPSHEDKISAFIKSYQLIQDYIANAPVPTDKKITNVAMAVEALVIWVHPFGDGNGRTGRFLGKLIEEGATDVDGLVEETALRSKRNRVYKPTFLTKEGIQERMNNKDLFDEYDPELIEKLPNDIDGMYFNIRHLLKDEATQQRTVRHVKQPQSVA